MALRCDRTSVGIVIELDGRYAMILRKNPTAWAFIARHVDNHETERDAIKAGVFEEGGLFLGRFNAYPEYPNLQFREIILNPCKRRGGIYHEWVIYHAYEWTGTLRASSGAKKAEWKTHAELEALARRTEHFMKKYDIPYTHTNALGWEIFGDPQKIESKNRSLLRRLLAIFKKTNPKTDPEWEQDPGLEPVWYYILKQLRII